MKFKTTLSKQTLSRLINDSAAIAVGILLGILIVGWGRFEFEWTFSIIDFLGLLLSFLVLFFLQHALSTRLTDHRVEKDMLIAAARKVSAKLEQIQEDCRASAAEDTLITAPSASLRLFKELSHELRTLEQLQELTPIVLDMDHFRNVRRGCLELKRLATRGAFPHGRLTSEENSAVQRKSDSIQIQVVKMIFYLNRL